jgi:hypothetical protein
MIRKIFWIPLIVLLLLMGCAPGTNNPQPAFPSAGDSIPLVSPTIKTVTTTTTVPALLDNITLTYPLVDTGQGKCYDNKVEMPCSKTSFSGQDAQYTSNAPSYTLSADGLTVNDNVTNLIWQRSPDTNGDGILNKSDKLTLEQANALPAQLNITHFGGYSDWRLPTIKELYSLIDFRGTDPSGASGIQALIPFIDTTYFQFAYGDAKAGERTIDSQYASSTTYVNRSAWGAAKLLGVNFADGRIKGYDLTMPGGTEKAFFVICVRGNPAYGINSFVDNGDQTITDNATSLMWDKTDSGVGMTWQEALDWVSQKNAASYLGHNDWRLPNIKELQSIVDYGRSPDTTNSAAISPLFESTQITNEAGQADFPFYWSSSTHAGSNGGGETADYIAFGRALGYMNNIWVDVHGAGAQRSDPKSGDAAQFPQGRGPQGDTIRIKNFVRLVRGGDVTATPDGNPGSTLPFLTVEVTSVQMNQPGGQNGLTGQQLDSRASSQSGTDPTGIPREAFQACSGLSQDATCSFTAPLGTVTGRCRAIQQQLVCVPPNKP